MTIFGISTAKIWLGIGQTVYMVGLSLIFIFLCRLISCLSLYISSLIKSR